MKEWILSIIGIVFICVVVEIIIPDGKMCGFIKHSLSLFILFVLFQPISSFFNNVKIESNDVNIDSNFLYNSNQEKINLLEKDIVLELEEQSINGACVIINANIFAENFVVDSVYVDATSVDCGENKFDLKNRIIDTVLKFLDIEKGSVVVYGV